MPYLSNQYKNFIRSARWQRLRAQHLKAHPLCARCAAKGRTTLATEVHHKQRCHDDPALQVDPRNLEAICNACHLPVSNDERRGYSLEMDSDGYYIDEAHPSNRGRHRIIAGTDATKLQRKQT